METLGETRLLLMFLCSFFKPDAVDLLQTVQQQINDLVLWLDHLRPSLGSSHLHFWRLQSITENTL